MLVLNVLGNLGADAEVREWNGKMYASFRVASTSKRKGNQTTTWVSILTSYSENLMPYLKKGQNVYVSGEAEIKTYPTRDGGTGVDISLFASSLALAGSPQRANDGVADSQSVRQPMAQQSANQRQIIEDSLPF